MSTSVAPRPPVLPQTAKTLVIGAGPSGLTLAASLALKGPPPLVVDRQEAGANTSRAAVVHARTLEVLEKLDVTPRLIAEGLQVPNFTIREHRRILAQIGFAELPTRYRYALMIPQNRTEAILEQRLGELGGAVHRGVRVARLTTQPDGVLVEVEGPSGAVSQILADRVVGADGAHSTVREHSGIAFRGGNYQQTFVLADVRMHWPLPDLEVQMFFSPNGMVVVAPLPNGHHRIAATVDGGTDDLGVGAVQRLIDERGPGGAKVLEVAWSSHFRVQHRIAERLHQGRFVIIGDAAHVHSPAGGQGMNTGIQDAIALARALTNPHTDRALDQYAAERFTVAQRVVTMTDRLTRLATVRGRIPRIVRNSLLSLVARQPRIQQSVALRLSELNPRL